MYTEVHSWTAHGCPMFKPSPYGKSVENRAERTVFKQLLKPYKLIRRCSHSARISLIGSKLGRRHLYSPVRQGVAAAKSAGKIDAVRAIHFYAL